MRVTVIVEDRWIRKDDVSSFLPDWPFQDSDIHAIQWYDDHGEIEWKNPFWNELITDDSIVLPYVEALEQYLLTVNPQTP